MKTLILLVLGLFVNKAESFGQGSIRFDSYNTAGGGVLTFFGPGVSGHSAGSLLNSGWTAGLLYSTSPIVEGATVNSLDALAPLNGAWSVAPNTAVFGGIASGYFLGPNFVLSDGFDGQVVYFEVIAFETSAAGADSAERYMNSTVRGHSASFTGVLYSLPNQPFFMDNLQSFSVYTIPEPSALALAGLGLAALMACRRKQA